MLKVKSKKGKEDRGLRKEMSANYCFREWGREQIRGKVEGPLEILNYNLKWTDQHSGVFFCTSCLGTSVEEMKVVSN